MSGSSGGMQSKLRETLKQEDAALAERKQAAEKTAAVIEPAGVVKAAARALPRRPVAVKAGPLAAGEDAAAHGEAERRDKHEKVERDSFSMPASEHKRIKAMREALGKAGVLASKSEVLRAGLALLAERDATEIARLVAALPKVAKGKRKKH